MLKGINTILMLYRVRSEVLSRGCFFIELKGLSCDSFFFFTYSPFPIQLNSFTYSTYAIKIIWNISRL